jgi:lipid-A-disaccharide synthase
VDHVACILPFEEQYFRNHGVRATFVGHPLFDELPANRDTGTWRRGDFTARAPVIGLLGGSRASEASSNFRPMLDAAARIASRYPGVEFLSPTTAATHAIVTREVARSGLNVSVAQDSFDDMVRRCDLCITVSGTATLHVAGWGVPMIVVYRGNPLLWHLIGRWIVKTRTYSLVNLLSDAHDHVVPEFIPWYGSSKSVSDLAIDMLSEPRRLKKQHDALRRLTRSLDRPGASRNTARLALDMIRGGATTIVHPGS